MLVIEDDEKTLINLPSPTTATITTTTWQWCWGWFPPATVYFCKGLYDFSLLCSLLLTPLCYPLALYHAHHLKHQQQQQQLLQIQLREEEDDDQTLTFEPRASTVFSQRRVLEWLQGL